MASFGTSLDNLKSFQWTRNSGILYYTDQFQHWNFVNKSYRRIDLIAVFVRVALELTKRAQHCVLLILHMFSCFFKIAQVYLRLAGCTVYKGRLQNEWVIKTFRKPPKRSKIVCMKSNLQFMHNLNYKMSRNSSNRSVFVKLRTTEDKHPKYRYRKSFSKKMPVRTVIWFRAKIIVTSLSRDVYSDRPKNNTIVKFSLCVIHVL